MRFKTDFWWFRHGATDLTMQQHYVGTSRTLQYLEQATIVRMEWPARSPDLNPIEHARDMLQTAVSSRLMQPASVQELRQALLVEWDQIPQYKIRRLISCMRRHCQAVIEARGHHTRY